MKIPSPSLLALAIVVAGCGGGDDTMTAGTSQPAASTGDASRAVVMAANTTGTATPDAASTLAPMYALDFVATAATGHGLNDAGDVVGRSYTDPGCGPFCLPPQQIAVWRGGNRIVLPAVPGFDGQSQYPIYINSEGLIAGEVGIPGSLTHAALWRPGGAGYTAHDLGTFPGTSSADVGGLDDQGRIVGWSTQGGAIPTVAVPFMWSQATGMVDLKALGYPNERPAAMSPGGKVVTWSWWYQLGEPASALPLPPVPRGFRGAGSNGSAINDAGDQAHFLVSTSTQNLAYPFRLSNGGSWQQISSFGTGHMSSYGMGSINAAQDISMTVGSTGAVAAGPAGLAQGLAGLLSPAYGGAAVTAGSPMNKPGQVLAQVMIGRSSRLVKMTPVTPCTANCLVSSSLKMTGLFVQDRRNPGSCFAGGTMYNLSTATVTVTGESGAPLANVQVKGRFLDDYWTDHRVSGVTNAAGVASWAYKGPCGVGAIAFLVDEASLGTRVLDRTRGSLAAFVVPGTTPPAPNKPPVPVPVVNCVAGRTCSFDAAGSYDPDGTITAYRWASLNGTTLSTQVGFSMTFPKPGLNSVVLHVTDDGGLTASKTEIFTVRR